MGLLVHGMLCECVEPMIEARDCLFPTPGAYLARRHQLRAQLLVAVVVARSLARAESLRTGIPSSSSCD